MALRNGPGGYGVLTKALHWLTVVALAGQFAVGYTLDDDGREVDCDRDRGGDVSDAEDDRLDRLEERCDERQDLLDEQADHPVGTAFSDLGSGDLLGDGLSWPEVHVLLGLLVLLLAGLRVAWRRVGELPPWAESLSAADRRLAHRTEQVLLVLLFVVPLTGVALVLGDDDLLPLHVAAHIAFFTALAVHLWLVLRRRLVSRML